MPRPVSAQGDAARAGAVLVDVVIHLEATPTGDNDIATLDQRTPYEKIIQYFADGVYEESNGAHKLRNVKIYTKGKYSGDCDILWKAAGGPCADAAGRGKAGKHVQMFTLFSGVDFLTDQEGGGYTLAHEWGHFYYGLYDEYKWADATYNASIYMPHSTDDPSNVSIMTSQWNARGGNFDWLNFSNSTRADYTNNNAQFRSYAAAGWQTLVRSPASDPKNGQRSTLAARPFYAELAAVAPTTGTSHIELPAVDSRSALKITWMSQNLSYQIVIDNSPSMVMVDPYTLEPAEKLANAKTAAKMLVDLADDKVTSMGIITFSSWCTVVAPLTSLNVPANKAALKSAIDGIGTGNGTAVYDGAQTALDGLNAVATTDTTRVVFLLSDGTTNSDSFASQASVIANYSAAHTPLFTFAYGDDADQVMMSNLALFTGGRFYYSPTSLGAIAGALNDANRVVSSNGGMADGACSPPPSESQSIPLAVDSTLKQFSAVVTYVGVPGDVDVHLLTPSGAQVTSTSLSASGSETMAYFQVSDPAPGPWQLVMTNNTTGTVTLKYQVDGLPDDVISYSLAVRSVEGGSIQYPTPIVLEAILEKGLPISGAVLTATVKTPSGAILPIVFRDDGVAPDVFADDGKYSAILDYTENGAYEILVDANNSLNQAVLTYRGKMLAIGPDGSVNPPADVPVGEDFTRSTRLQVMVSGVVPDDHGNTPGTATPIGVDNQDHDGRIDFVGDVDAFRIDGASTSQSLMVRVTNLALGMDPKLVLLGSDMTTTLSQGTLEDNAAPRGYLVLKVARPTNPMYALVSNLTTGTALYSVSAGAEIGVEGSGASLLRIDRWGLKPGKSSDGAITLAGEFLSTSDTLTLEKDGVVLSFNAGSVRQTLDAAGFVKGTLGRYSFRGAKASGSFQMNIGGSSRCKFSVKMSGDYSSLEGVAQMQIRLQAGGFDDDVILGAVLKGDGGTKGASFSSAKDSYISPELFVDSYQIKHLTAGPGKDSLHLAVRLPGAPVYGHQADTLQVKLGFATFEVAPGDWKANAKGTTLQATLSDLLGAGSQVVVKFLPQKRLLSVQASKADLSGCSSAALVGVSFSGYKQSNSLTLQTKSSKSGQQFAF